MGFDQRKSIVVALALVLGCSPVAAQDGTIIERNDAVDNIVVIDGKLVVRGQLSGEQSGISVNVEGSSPETHAMQQAIENRLEGQVQPNPPSGLVKGRMDNLVQVKGVFASERSDDAQACVQIGTVAAKNDCEREK